jgi:hypothetical protein
MLLEQQLCGRHIHFSLKYGNHACIFVPTWSYDALGSYGNPLYALSHNDVILVSALIFHPKHVHVSNPGVHIVYVDIDESLRFTLAIDFNTLQHLATHSSASLNVNVMYNRVSSCDPHMTILE